jgi:two-component system response regulator YesN
LLKLAIVDDEFIVRLGIKSMTNWEYHNISIVGEASNGRDALIMCRNLKPDIVLTDIKMPVMDGLEFLRQLREDDPYVKVVILSCYNDFEYVREALRLGAIDYLLKPTMTSDDVIQLINRIKTNIEKENRLENNLASNDNNHKIKKQNVLLELLSGMYEVQYPLEKLKALGVDLSNENLAVFALKPDNLHLIPSICNKQDATLMYAAISNIIDDSLSTRQEPLYIHDNNGYFTVIYRCDEKVSYKNIYSEVYNFCMHIRNIIKKYLNISVSIGIGDLQATQMNLAKASSNAQNALEMRFFEGSGSIILYQHKRNTSGELPSISELNGKYPLLKYAVSGDITSFIESISDIKKELKNAPTVKQARNFLLEIMFNLFNEFNQITGINDQSIDSIYDYIINSDTLDTACDFICDRMQDLVGNDVFTNENNKIINSIKLNIRQHYNKDLNLDLIASKYNISKNYLCHLFKKTTGETYLSYLTAVRMEKAKELLLKTNMKTYEIAEMVGIPNPRYFSRLFKKSVGMLPTDFKNFNESTGACSANSVSC